MSDRGMTYRDVGVDLDAAESIKERMRALVEGTRRPGVRAGFGSFGGRFRVEEATELVASADGVGTKLAVAVRAGRHDTVGEDLVNHCVNDVLCEGAEPLFFLDYVASGVLDPGTTLAVVEGVARGCRRNGCALLGGETAEMPDFYDEGEYELAGFVVGCMAFPEVARRRLRAGDRLVGLASAGIHTNGYSFVREVVFGRAGLGVDDPFPGIEAEGTEGRGQTVADVLLRVHRSYLEPLRGPCASGRVRALAHVTGGGVPGNLGRVLPGTLDADVNVRSWETPPLFRWLAEESGAGPEEMHRVFNMGVGMIAVVREEDEDWLLERLEGTDCRAFPCGRLVEGGGEVRLRGLGRTGRAGEGS